MWEGEGEGEGRVGGEPLALQQGRFGSAGEEKRDVDLAGLDEGMAGSS